MHWSIENVLDAKGRYGSWVRMSDGELIAYYNRNFIGKKMTEIRPLYAGFHNTLISRGLTKRINALAKAFELHQYPHADERKKIIAQRPQSQHQSLPSLQVGA